MSLCTRSKLLALGLALGQVPGTPARADVVAIVSVSSPINSLGKNEIVDVFLGKKLRLPDGQQVVPVDQEEGTRARAEFYEKYANKSAPQLKAHWSKAVFTGRGKPPRTVADDGGLKKLLANNPHAIGYIDRSQVDNTIRILQLH